MVASWVYIAFDIKRPTIAAKELSTYVSMWRATVEALSAIGTSMDEIVQGVTCLAGLARFRKDGRTDTARRGKTGRKIQIFRRTRTF